MTDRPSTRIITQHWNDPEPGIIAYLVTFNPHEWADILHIFSWLEEHAKDNWDQALSSWAVHEADGMNECTHGIGFKAFLHILIRESRYDEFPPRGAMYGGTCPAIEEHL